MADYARVLNSAPIYYISVTMVRQGKATMEGTGQGTTAKEAIDVAQLELIDKLKHEYDAMKLEKQLKQQADRQEQLLRTSAVKFNYLWNATLAINLKRGDVTEVNEAELQRFVVKHLQQAKEAKTPQVLGMDTEGQYMTKERAFHHAHYMQIAAGSDNECVVFRTTADNLVIVLPLFLESNIVIAVAGKKGEETALKNIFSPDDLGWMKRIEDVQVLGKKVMGWQINEPSLATMLSHMWGIEPPLSKFLAGEGPNGRDKAYACFNNDTQVKLDADMLLYAALDAMAAKALYEKYTSLPTDPAPAESNKGDGDKASVHQPGSLKNRAALPPVEVALDAAPFDVEEAKNTAPLTVEGAPAVLAAEDLEATLQWLKDSGHTSVAALRASFTDTSVSALSASFT
jgi:hypothetical protein